MGLIIPHTTSSGSLSNSTFIFALVTEQGKLLAALSNFSFLLCVTWIESRKFTNDCRQCPQISRKNKSLVKSSPTECHNVVQWKGLYSENYTAQKTKRKATCSETNEFLKNDLRHTSEVGNRKNVTLSILWNRSRQRERKKNQSTVDIFLWKILNTFHK